MSFRFVFEIFDLDLSLSAL